MRLNGPILDMQVADTAGAPSDGRPDDERRLTLNNTLYNQEFNSAAWSTSADLSPAFAKDAEPSKEQFPSR